MHRFDQEGGGGGGGAIMLLRRPFLGLLVLLSYKYIKLAAGFDEQRKGTYLEL